MMKYSKVLLLLIPLILGLACSHKAKTDADRLNDSRVVLKVGDSKLTLGDIETQVGIKTEFRDPMDEYTRKKAVVDKTIEQFLMIEAAKKEGFTAQVDSNTMDRNLLRGYYNDKILSRVNVTDADINDFFNKYGGQIQVGHILVADSVLSESLYTVIKSGGDFSELAKKFSQEPVTRDNGGSIGYREYSGLLRYGNSFVNTAFTLKTGEVSKPVRSSMGWHIIKSFDRIKNTKADLEQDKNKYHGIVNTYMQKKMVDDFISQLKRKYHFEVVKPTLELLILKSDSTKALGNLPAGLGSAAYLDSMAFTEAQKEMNIVNYDGGGIKLREFLKVIISYGPQRAPDLRDSFVMDQVYEQIGVPPLLLMAAHKEGFDKTASFIKDAENAKNVLLAQQMRDKIYKDLPSVTEQDVQNYYNSHKEEFFIPNSLRVSGVALKTEEEAKEMLARAKAGANIAALANSYSVDKATGANGGDLGFFTGDKRLSKYPQIYEAAEGMKSGDLGGPVQMAGNWWIFRVTQRLEKTQKDLSLARSDINGRLTSQYRVTHYQDWIAQAKKDMPIEMNLDLIKNNLRMGILSDTTNTEESKSSGQ